LSDLSGLSIACPLWILDTYRLPVYLDQQTDKKGLQKSVNPL